VIAATDRDTAKGVAGRGSPRTRPTLSSPDEPRRVASPDRSGWSAFAWLLAEATVVGEPCDQSAVLDATR